MPELSSQIVAVTVFSDRARVTRRAKTTLEGGAHRLEFTELPITVDRDSIRVAARGTAGLKLLGVDAKPQYFRETPVAKLREMEARLQSLQDEDAADADRADLLAKHLAHLDGLSDATRIYANGLATGKTSVEQQHQLVSYLDQGRETIQTRARALGLQRRERNKEIDKLQKELGQAKGAKPKERVAVTVEAKASARGEFEIEVTYVIPGASWQPLYDIRLLIDQIELAYLGQVKQQTGEDWNGVRLTLSTAQPAVRAEIPQLEPWHLRPQSAARMVALAAPERLDPRCPISRCRRRLLLRAWRTWREQRKGPCLTPRPRAPRWNRRAAAFPTSFPDRWTFPATGRRTRRTWASSACPPSSTA